jgi:hypothetical protein
LKSNGQLTAPQLCVEHRTPPQDRRQPNSAPHRADPDDQIVVDPAQRQRSSIKLGQR